VQTSENLKALIEDDSGSARDFRVPNIAEHTEGRYRVKEDVVGSSRRDWTRRRGRIIRRRRSVQWGRCRG